MTYAKYLDPIAVQREVDRLTPMGLCNGDISIAQECVFYKMSFADRIEVNRKIVHGIEDRLIGSGFEQKSVARNPVATFVTLISMDKPQQDFVIFSYAKYLNPTAVQREVDRLTPMGLGDDIAFARECAFYKMTADDRQVVNMCVIAAAKNEYGIDKFSHLRGSMSFIK